MKLESSQNNKPGVHILIIDLLKQIEPYFDNLIVEDKANTGKLTTLTYFNNILTTGLVLLKK
ncbi:hypothetical protein A3860_39725 [Niastella vici]|uniref:Uncharacterized protein n=1 Tax=Niastella vici TaxID=1703345 RepID=A0A1V9FHS3_9BACT|nr:hypothetical protein A3860_39725 [Niastella vici]